MCKGHICILTFYKEQRKPSLEDSTNIASNLIVQNYTSHRQRGKKCHLCLGFIKKPLAWVHGCRDSVQPWQNEVLIIRRKEKAYVGITSSLCYVNSCDRAMTKHENLENKEVEFKYFSTICDRVLTQFGM